MSFFIYLGIGAIVLVYILLKSPKGKGRVGEFRVNRAIKRGLDCSEYTLIKDVTIYDEEGTTQIDHLVVSPYGIFVIETKNLKGWIFGGLRQQEWTQSIYRKKFTFQNPIRQNYRHVKALESALTLESKYFFPVVAFVGDCTLKTHMPDNVFVGIRSLLGYIKSVDQVQFSPSEMAILIERIEGVRLSRSHATNQLHIENLKNEGKQVRCRRNNQLKASKAIAILVLALVILLFFTQFKRPTGNNQTILNDLFPVSELSLDGTQANQVAESQKHNGKRQGPPLYLVQLKSGGSLHAKNIVKTKDTVAYDDGKGLITTINRIDIEAIKRLR